MGGLVRSLDIVWKCALAIILASPVLAQDFKYEGRKKCSSCHKSQYESWSQTAHATALDSLLPGKKTEPKLKAKLDPDKDYSKDKDCVGCHTTGYGGEDGYEVDFPSIYLEGVGCESCHGPGQRYQRIHRTAAKQFKKRKKATPREQLVQAGEEFMFVERCNACHMNYEGSPWPGAHEPFTPFTPAVDPKYAFDFDQAVRDDKAMHKHYRLEGVFTGPPLSEFHEEFQSNSDLIGK